MGYLHGYENHDQALKRLHPQESWLCCVIEHPWKWDDVAPPVVQQACHQGISCVPLLHISQSPFIILESACVFHGCFYMFVLIVGPKVKGNTYDLEFV